ncbi:MAG: DUF2169 domain-containing protein, partial [Myxococcota bacterium]
VDHLDPGATITLAGMHADRPVREAQLPNCSVRGGITGLDPHDPDRAQRLSFRADSVHVHADQDLCVVSWRAVVELASEAQAPSLGVVAGVELRSSPRSSPARDSTVAETGPREEPALPFLSSSEPRLPPASRPIASKRGPTRRGSTVGVEALMSSLAPKAAVPFTQKSSPPEPPRRTPASWRGSTLDAGSRSVPPVVTLPFHPDAEPAPGSVPPSPAERVPVQRGYTVDTDTLRAMGGDALPFGPPPSSSSTVAGPPELAPPSAPSEVASAPTSAPPEMAPPSPPTSAPPEMVPPSAVEAPSLREPAPPSSRKPPRKRPERVIRVPSPDDPNPEPTRKPPRRKAKPVPRAQKKTDVNAILYRKKS